MATEIDFSIRNDDASMLGQLLGAGMPEAAAKWLLNLKFPDAWNQDADELSRKNNAGDNTEAEVKRLDTYVHVGDLLSILQLQAKKAAGQKIGAK
jgi:hypothetical protein